jgi:hypothetical protein
VKLVDTLASGASEHYARGGSSPLIRTNPDELQELINSKNFAGLTI